MKFNFVEIQIPKRESIKNFPLLSYRTHVFCCSLCMNFTLKSQEMAIPEFKNQNFPGGACPRTPRGLTGLRARL